MISPTLPHVLLALGTFVAMEGVATLAHRWLMHGPLWCLHRSHHEPRRGVLEANDWFAVAFALPSVALIAAGVDGREPLAWIGIGMTAYGAVYFLVHDGFVHRRLPLPRPRRGTWLARIVHAHRLHHAVRTREGAVAFGFLHAPDPARLRARLKARRLV